MSKNSRSSSRKRPAPRYSTRVLRTDRRSAWSRLQATTVHRWSLICHLMWPRPAASRSFRRYCLSSTITSAANSTALTCRIIHRSFFGKSVTNDRLSGTPKTDRRAQKRGRSEWRRDRFALHRISARRPGRKPAWPKPDILLTDCVSTAIVPFDQSSPRLRGRTVVSRRWSIENWSLTGTAPLRKAVPGFSFLSHRATIKPIHFHLAS